MNLLRILPLACLLAIGAVEAQSAGECPLLPGDSHLSWKAMTGDDFVFCKALQEDGGEVFAVTIAKDSPFEPKRADRAEEAVIDGHETRWYRGEIASAPQAQVRETLIELGNGRVAHISLRANSEAELASALQQAQSLRFHGPQLSSN
ncbi:hypothetical protein [Luteimonas notoginsengisoli]|jgi:hypothetical protein|uniref:Uncharacterized protein n=1 Tax=Luteimonas notoginsengisoli TaxID=1578200 RepID=A0ABV7UR46_9GAMM